LKIKDIIQKEKIVANQSKKNIEEKWQVHTWKLILIVLVLSQLYK
jgi:hypothetical protein